MKEHGIKILYGILVLGFIISIFHIINGKNGAGLGNVIETLTITSIVLFFSTLIYIFYSFKYNIKKVSVWFLLILSCPLALKSLTHLTKEYSLELTETTTPKKFLNEVKVDPNIYNRDKLKIEKLIDSLIKIKTIERPAELALRYFNGQNYNDTIERDWAIDLPTNLEYKEIIVDTLFYSKNGKDIISGLLITKVFNEYMNYPKGGIEFSGNGFVHDKNDFKQIKLLKYSVGGYENYKPCSNRLRYYYLKKIGTFKKEYNMNDIRFINQYK
jgi:hypothetical protein